MTTFFGTFKSKVMERTSKTETNDNCKYKINERNKPI